MMAELLILIGFVLFIVIFYFIIYPKFRKDMQDDVMAYVETVEKRLQPFLSLPGQVAENSERIGTLVDLLMEQQSSYEPSSRVLKGNLDAIMASKKALVESQMELGKLGGENVYMSNYIAGSEKAASEAAHRLGVAVHNVPIEMIERLQVGRERHKDGDSTLRKMGIREDLKEEKAAASEKALRDKQELKIDADAAEADMDATGNQLTKDQKRRAKALEKSLKDAQKRMAASGELDDMGLEGIPTEMKNEDDIMRFLSQDFSE